MNLLFSRLLRDFIDRKHRFVAGSQVNDRAQRSEPRPTVDFFPVVASKRDRSNDLFQFPAVITEILRQIFLPFSLFLSSFFSFFLFLFPLFTQFLTFFHAPSRSSFETDRRVHLLFLRSMLHDRLTYKPRTG